MHGYADSGLIRLYEIQFKLFFFSLKSSDVHLSHYHRAETPKTYIAVVPRTIWPNSKTRRASFFRVRLKQVSVFMCVFSLGTHCIAGCITRTHSRFDSIRLRCVFVFRWCEPTKSFTYGYRSVCLCLCLCLFMSICEACAIERCVRARRPARLAYAQK